jgi:hypothetical protein
MMTENVWGANNKKIGSLLKMSLKNDQV